MKHCQYITSLKVRNIKYKVLELLWLFDFYLINIGFPDKTPKKSIKRKSSIKKRKVQNLKKSS